MKQIQTGEFSIVELLKTIELKCGQTYLLKLADGNILESGDVFMAREQGYGTRPYKFEDFENPSDTEKRVMTVCTMAGCSCSCKFCASRNSFKRNLTAQEIVGQVDRMIEEGILRGRNSDPNNSKEFRVLYTRMGEPMLNIDNVIESIKMLIKRYPHIIIGMSTSGFKTGLDKLLENPEIVPYLDFQFSLHSTSDVERDYLFGIKAGNNKVSISDIGEYVDKMYAITKKKISLNVILFKGYTYDFKELAKTIDKNKIWIRLSPWNLVTDSESEYDFQGLLKLEDVIAKKPVSGAELEKVINDLDELGIAYAYAPAIDEEIKNNVACGQALEAFKKEVLTTA